MMSIVDGRDCARGSVLLSKTMLIIYNIRAFFLIFKYKHLCFSRYSSVTSSDALYT